MTTMDNDLTLLIQYLALENEQLRQKVRLLEDACNNFDSKNKLYKHLLNQISNLSESLPSALNNLQHLTGEINRISNL